MTRQNGNESEVPDIFIHMNTHASPHALPLLWIIFHTQYIANFLCVMIIFKTMKNWDLIEWS